MPNSRFMKEGSMKIGFSNSFPNEYTYITATPFSWLEASYKYTEQKIFCMDLLHIVAINPIKIKVLI